MATRPEPFEVGRGGEPDVPALVATAVTAVATSATEATVHQRLIRPDKSTFHCRGPPDQALGSPDRQRFKGPWVQQGTVQVPQRPDGAVVRTFTRDLRRDRGSEWF